MDTVRNGRRKAFYLLLSILVACGIWLYADLTDNRLVTQEFRDVPIEYIRAATLTDRGLMLVDEGSDLTIDLELQGTRWLIANLDPSYIRVVADLSNVTSAGVQNIGYSINFTDSRFRNNAIQRKQASIDSATVNISELYRRTVAVRCDLVGSVAETYTAGQVQLSHTEIEVRGLQEDIDPIGYAKVTLDIGDAAAESISQELAVQFYDEQGQLLENDGIHSTVEKVQATLPVSVTKELKLVVNFVEAPGARLSSTDYTIEPGTITVSGDASRLKNMDTLVLGEYKLTELGTTASQNYTTTNYPIIMPEGCQNLSGVTRAALRIRFEDMASAAVSTGNIVWKNLPEDKRADLLAPELSVRIYGTQAEVSAVTGDSITVTVDLGDYASASGTYTIPAEVSVASGDIGIIGEYQVQVTIRDGAEEEPGEPGEPPPEEQPE